MVTEGEANEFLTLLFGELNEKRFAQVIKVKIFFKNTQRTFSNYYHLGLFEIRSI